MSCLTAMQPRVSSVANVQCHDDHQVDKINIPEDQKAWLKTGKRGLQVDSLDFLVGVDQEEEIEHAHISVRVAEKLEGARKKLRRTSAHQDENEIFALFMSDMPLPEAEEFPRTDMSFDSSALSDFLSSPSSSSSKDSFWGDIFVMEQEA